MPVSPKLYAVAAVLAGTVLVARGFSGGRRRSRRRTARPGVRRIPSPTTTKGAVVCPFELKMPSANTTGVKAGDYVALRLADHKGTFTELVWALVESRSHHKLTVRLTGQIGQSTIKMPATEHHGFDVGMGLQVDDECAWEVFHTTPDGMALCGLFFDEVNEGLPPAKAATVGPGQQVAVYVAPVKPGTVLTPASGWNVANRVWATVTRVSKTHSVMRIALIEAPAPTPGLDLGIGDRLDVSRDCIADVRPGGS